MRLPVFSNNNGYLADLPLVPTMRPLNDLPARFPAAHTQFAPARSCASALSHRNAILMHNLAAVAQKRGRVRHCCAHAALPAAKPPTWLTRPPGLGARHQEEQQQKHQHPPTAPVENC